MFVYLLLNVFCVNLNICFLLQTPLSSLMQQRQGGGGYEIYTLKILGCSTTTVGEADGRALSGIFGLVWAVFDYFVTFCRLIIILPPCFVCCYSKKSLESGTGVELTHPSFHTPYLSQAPWCKFFHIERKELHILHF